MTRAVHDHVHVNLNVYVDVHDNVNVDVDVDVAVNVIGFFLLVAAILLRVNPSPIKEQPKTVRNSGHGSSIVLVLPAACTKINAS